MTIAPSQHSSLRCADGGVLPERRTRDAKYEADRAAVPLSLLDLDDLVALALELYDVLDVEAKRLLALKRLYWPA